jgi:hypothetical protein
MIVEENKMKNINYHNVKIFLKSNKKTTETGKIDTSITHIYMSAQVCTSIKYNKKSQKQAKLIPLSHTYT